jgi:hypothetical protein
MAQICYPGLQDQSQPGLYSETLSQNKNKTKKP